MKIAIISDTHARKNISRFMELVHSNFKDVDIIMHAGDYTTPKVIEALKDFKPFAGVYGNNDNEDIKNLVKEKEIYTVFNYKIGLCHGHGFEKNTMQRALDIFANDNVDIIIFGHSHQPLITTKGNILMLNPGSPTHKKSQRWHSFIILDIKQDHIAAQIHFY